MPLVKAAVATSPNAPLVFRELELSEPECHEILVRTLASGVCHTDMLLRDGAFGPKLPAVAGHEGAGIVEAVGRSVRTLRVGDHVLLTQSSCGGCRNCRSARPMNCQHYAEYNITGRRANGKASFRQEIAGNFVGQSSFATHILADENGAVLVPRDLPMDIVAPLGCGLTTGASTVLNVLKPPAGASIVVFGAGAVGLAAIMAARVSGCDQIVAIDLYRTRLDLALEMGATHVLHGNSPTLAIDLRAITGDGAAFGIDAVGLPSTIELLFESVCPGGHIVLLGANGSSGSMNLDLTTLLFNRRIEGAILGNQIPQVTIPELLSLQRRGRFPIERLITRFPFAEVNEAMRAAEAGEVIKPVLIFE